MSEKLARVADKRNGALKNLPLSRGDKGLM